MSSNRFNLDRAVDALRSEQPSPEARTRARNALLNPAARPFRPRLLVLGVVGAAAVALLWPRPGTGEVWAQVKSNMRGQLRMHMALYQPGFSRPYMEKWYDGPKYRMNFLLRSLKPGAPSAQFFSVCDGKRALTYRGTSMMKNGEPRAAHVTKVTHTADEFVFAYGIMGADSNLIDDVVKQEGWKVDDRKDGEETRYGNRDVYTLSIVYSKRYTSRARVYVDPQTKLIREVDSLSETGKEQSFSKIDYPESLSPHLFDIVAPNNAPIRDIDEENATLAASIKKGLGRKTVAGKTITLRAVLHAGYGELWVLWTGGSPAGSLEHPIRVKGFEGRKPFGIKAFTVTPDAKSKPSPACGERLGGMWISVPDKKLDRLTITVPVLDATGKKKLGSATFANVAVFRIDSLYDYAVTLGMR